MPLIDILAADRVGVLTHPVDNKRQVLQQVAELLARARTGLVAEDILESLMAREALQSTGVGAGVAVPHAKLAFIDRPIAALLVCSHPVKYDAIDDLPVRILFALIGPQGQSANHLKMLARVSRVLRPEAFRQRLIDSQDAGEIFTMVRDRARAV